MRLATDNQITQQIFNTELPVLPLFYHLKVMAARPDLCGVSLDVSARSGIKALEGYDLSQQGIARNSECKNRRSAFFVLKS